MQASIVSPTKGASVTSHTGAAQTQLVKAAILAGGAVQRDSVALRPRRRGPYRAPAFAESHAQARRPLDLLPREQSAFGPLATTSATVAPVRA